MSTHRKAEDSFETSCQESFEELLVSLRSSNQPDNSCNYIRKIYKLESCDQFHDMKILRIGFDIKLNHNSDGQRLKRILSSIESPEDVQRASFVCGYYKEWTEDELMAGLQWDNWAYYKAKKVKELVKKLWQRE